MLTVKKVIENAKYRRAMETIDNIDRCTCEARADGIEWCLRQFVMDGLNHETCGRVRAEMKRLRK